MMIQQVVTVLEALAHPALQEKYDNAGLICGLPEKECTGIMVSLDATEAVIGEAIARGCNMVVSHHPIVFSGLKRLTGRSYVERAVMLAIKNDVALYASHTNLDNVQHGVNGHFAEKLGLRHCRILEPKKGTLVKLYTFVPLSHADRVRDALFAAGAGHIGKYSECSFSQEGSGTYKAGEGARPFLGTKGERHREEELKVEVVLPSWLEGTVTRALLEAHPYEEVAFDMVALQNAQPGIGSGMIGELEAEMAASDFLQLLKGRLGLTVVRHTALTGRPVKRVAVCGGAGSFLISSALAAKADVFVTSDVKYHEFFDAEGRLVVADIGHYETEVHSIDLLVAHLREKFRNFATLKTTVNTNPVQYFT